MLEFLTSLKRDKREKELGAAREQYVVESDNLEKIKTDEQRKMFLETRITEFLNSADRIYMDTAQRYYENKTDIQKAKRLIIGKGYDNKTATFESKLLANNKLSHNYFKKLTRQKISYMLANPFMLIQTQRDDQRALALFEALKPYFDNAFYKRLKNIGRDSIVKGLGWLQVYYDNTGMLRFDRISPEEVIPCWGDRDHTFLEGIIRFYSVRYFSGEKTTIQQKVEYYTLDGVYHYIRNDAGKLISDPEKPEIVPHFTLTNAETQEQIGINWSKVPFIPFKYDPDEKSLLVRIKDLIDDYDKKTSNIANMIDDIPNAVKVVKNYDGRDKEEFSYMLAQFRMLFVQEDGDAKTLETPLNVGDLDVHLQRLREDIYEFGQGVNTADREIRDTSGVALRFIYADLDMDCMDWGDEFKWSLRDLVWFIIQDIKSKTGEDYSDVQYDIVFDTDVIINESETIQNCLTSKGIISDETIAANHPWTLNAAREIEEMRKDEEDAVDLEHKYDNIESENAQKQQDEE